MEVDLDKPYLEGLTYKQKLFVLFYKGNATEAAEKAGYKGNRNTLAQMGDENLRKPKIAEALKGRDGQDEQKKSNIISRKEMEEELSRIIRGEEEYKDVKPQEIIKAIERLAKMRGYDKESLEIHGTLETMSDNGLDVMLVKTLEIVGIEAPKKMKLLGK